MDEHLNILSGDVFMQRNEQQRDQLNAQKEEAQAEADKTSWVDKVLALRGQHETFDYESYTYDAEDGFNINDHKEVFSAQSRYVKEALIKANPQSTEELNYQVEKLKGLEDARNKYSELNFDNVTANIGAALLDPASWVIGLGTGGLGLGAKVAGAGVRGAMIDSVIAETAIATTKLANNNVYDVNDMLADVALSPVGGLPVGLMYLSKGKRLERQLAIEAQTQFKNMNKSLRLEQRRDAGELLGAGEEAWLDANPSYETSFKAIRLDRYAKYTRLLDDIDPEASQFLRNIIQDPTGSRTPDAVGQGVNNAEAIADTVREQIKEFNVKAYDAVMMIAREQKASFRVNRFNPRAIEDIIKTTQKKVLEAAFKRDRSILTTEGERAFFDAQVEVGQRIAKYGKERGVKLFSEVDADEFYIPIKYQKHKIHGYERKDVVALLEEGFKRGSEGLDDMQAKLLAKSMYGKLTNEGNNDGVSGLVDNFNELIEYLSDSEVLTRLKDDPDFAGMDLSDVTKVREILGVNDKDPNKAARRRAQIDRTISVTTEDGRELSFYDIMDTDGVRNTQSYVNNMSGHIGIELATGGNIRDLRKAVEKIKKSPKAQMSTDGGNKLDAMLEDLEAVLFGRASKNVEGSVIANNLSNLATTVMLGFAGAASIPNMVKTLVRHSFVGGSLLLPKRVLPKSKQAMYDLIEEAEGMGYLFRSQSAINMFSSAMEESLAGSEGGLTTALRQGARFTAKVGGMDYMGRTIEQQAFAGGLTKMFKAAKAGKVSPILLSEAGWSKAEIDGIMTKLRDTPKARASGLFRDGEINVPNLDGWTDQELHKLYQGLAIYARRQADRNYRGEGVPFLESPAGRLLFQFRSIILQSYAKKGLNALNSLKTAQGGKDAVVGALTEAAALTVLYQMKAEAKMNGMSEEERERYIKRLGFDDESQYNRLFYGTAAERLKEAQNVDFKVMSGVFSYSPTLSWLSEPLAVIGSLSNFDTGGRHKSVEETALSMPSVGFVEAGAHTVKNMARLAFDKDSKMDIETAHRARSMLPANSHPLVQYATNVMIREANLERRDK